MKIRILFIITLILALGGCKPFDNCEFEDKLGIAVALNLDQVTEPVNNVHIYVFDVLDRLNVHRYYSSQEELEADRLIISGDGYTVLAVINVGENFAPPQSSETKAELPNIVLLDFIAWLQSVEPQYPDIMTGMGKEAIDNNGVLTITIVINEGISHLLSNILRLDITIPEGELPDYATRLANHNMRVVADVYRKGTSLRVHSTKAILSDYRLDLELTPGEYDILLWADYTPLGSLEDHHYSTTTLRGVRLNEQTTYVSSAESRNAFSHSFNATVPDQPITNYDVTLKVLMAKYNLVATDVKRYKELIAGDEKEYPALEDLSIKISYDGYFPNSFDVATGKPNDSKLQVEFSSVIMDITETTALLSSDYIFTSDEDSYLNATVTILKKNGAILTQIPGVYINYYRGYTSTVDADFLTAGVIDRGISIDTEWGGEINVYFN